MLDERCKRFTKEAKDRTISIFSPNVINNKYPVFGNLIWPQLLAEFLPISSSKAPHSLFNSPPMFVLTCLSRSWAVAELEPLKPLGRLWLLPWINHLTECQKAPAHGETVSIQPSFNREEMIRQQWQRRKKKTTIHAIFRKMHIYTEKIRTATVCWAVHVVCRLRK